MRNRLRKNGRPELFAHPFDQRTIDIESLVDILEITRFIGLMALGGLAGPDDDRRHVVKPGTNAEASVKYGAPVACGRVARISINRSILGSSESVAKPGKSVTTSIVASSPHIF